MKVGSSLVFIGEKHDREKKVAGSREEKNRS